MKLFTFILFVLLSLSGCSQNNTADKPNILWIVTEDISPTLSFYGDSTAQTPHLDKLASQSVIYSNAFSVVGVCAPSRSSIITGMYPTTLGTVHMRTGKDVFSWGKRVYADSVAIKDINGNPIRQYSAVIPEYVKCFPEYLRAAGYFCTNNAKTDYQFAAPITAWDENGSNAHWRNRNANQPFFSVFNIGLTHESRIWLHKDKPQTVNPDSVPLPPYFPDNAVTRTDVARHYSNIELMDAKVGKIVQQLKDDGLYDNTIIFFYSDHGGPLPHQKREIYDSGLRVPFLVKGLNNHTPSKTDRLISFVDLAPTLLSLANIEPPKYMEGKAFLGKYQDTPRKYVYGSSDRFDEFTDRIRSVRNKQFLYLKNYHPELVKYKDVGYRKNMPMMNNILELKDNKQLDSTQMQWFETKPSEELYDCKTDPYNITDIASNPDYQSVLSSMRQAYTEFNNNHDDKGRLPEAELIASMWPNNTQPITEKPIISIKNSKVQISSKTKGASIAYIISDTPDLTLDFNSHWQLYTKPFTVESGKTVYAIAERIGFKESNIESFKIQ